MKRFSLALLYVAALVGCSEQPIPTNNSVPVEADILTAADAAVFSYTGFSAQGRPIVRGHLAISRADSNRIVGRWRLRVLADTSIIGPQHGHGTLVGEVHGNRLSINLHPQYADNNVYLWGQLERGVYAGRWQWVGFPGVLNAGSFRAVAGHRAAQEE